MDNPVLLPSSGAVVDYMTISMSDIYILFNYLQIVEKMIINSE